FGYSAGGRGAEPLTDSRLPAMENGAVASTAQGTPVASPLLEAIDRSRLPRHIAIIMDGNGRWAQRQGLPRVAGHRAGVESLKSVVEAAGTLGIEVLTVYAFSTENWERP